MAYNPRSYSIAYSSRLVNWQKAMAVETPTEPMKLSFEETDASEGDKRETPGPSKSMNRLYPIARRIVVTAMTTPLAAATVDVTLIPTYN